MVMVGAVLAFLSLAFGQATNTPPKAPPGYTQFWRGFVQGERDVFSFTGEIRLENGGVITMKGEHTQFFRKVERAEAEISMLTTNRLKSVGLNEDWSETNRLSRGRYNVFGIIISPEKSQGKEIAFGNILHYGMLIPYKGLQPKGEQKFDYRFAENQDYYTRGTFERLSVTPEEVVIRVKVQFFNGETPVPASIEATTTWNLVTRRAKKIDLIAHELPQAKGSAKVESITIRATVKSDEKTAKS